MSSSSPLLSMIDKSLPVVGAEVGVWCGSASSVLLNDCPSLTLHMIDRWSPFTPKCKEYAVKGDTMSRMSQREHDKAYGQASDAVKFAGNRAVIKRGESVKIAATYDNEYFDFVFIDAEHSMVAALSDMYAWYPKIKPGGLLCGHDYGHKRFPGVALAVKNFINDNNLKIDKETRSCWFIRKVK